MAELLTPSCERWTHLLQALEHDFYHHPAYMDLEARRLGLTAVAIADYEGGSATFVPLLLKAVGNQLHASSAHGYPGILSQRPRYELARLEEALSQHGIASAFIRQHPLIDLELEPGQRSMVRVEGETFGISLTHGPNEDDRLLDSYHKSTRRDIRRAQREGLRASQSNDHSSVIDFHSVYAATMERLNAKAGYRYPRDYLESFLELPGVDATIVRVHASAGEVLSAGLFTRTGPHAQYHLGGTLIDRHLGGYATKLMLHHGALWASKRGAHHLHLGGGQTIGRQGLHDLKRRFADVTFTYRTVRLVGDRTAFRELTGPHYEIKAALQSAYFPPHLPGETE